jgi:hypothetical protein
MRIIGIGTAAIVGLIAIGVAAQAPQRPADTILVNAHVVTVDRSFSIAQAIAITGGRFTAVGADAAIRKLAGPGTTTIDLHGQTVIPGLADGIFTMPAADPRRSAPARSPTCSRPSPRASRRAVPATSSSATATGMKRSSRNIACRTARIRCGLPDNPVVPARGGHGAFSTRRR